MVLQDSLLQNETENSYQNVITQGDRSLLQSMSGIAKCVCYYKAWWMFIIKYISYHKVWQTVDTKFVRYYKMCKAAITKCVRYYKMWQLLQSET